MMAKKRGTDPTQIPTVPNQPVADINNIPPTGEFSKPEPAPIPGIGVLKFTPPVTDVPSVAAPAMDPARQKVMGMLDEKYKGDTGSYTFHGQKLSRAEFEKAKYLEQFRSEGGYGEAEAQQLAQYGSPDAKKQVAQGEQQKAALGMMQPQTAPIEATGPTPLDWNQAALSSINVGTLTKTVGGAIGGAAISAKAGALLGTAIAPGVGSAIGAGAGLALGIGMSVYKNIKQQKSEDITAQTYTISQGSRNLNKIVSLVNVDPANAPYYMDLYNQQMNKISQSYSQLKLDTSSDLNLMLSEDGTTALVKYEGFYAPGGMKDYYDAKMREAVLTPNPNAPFQTLLMSEEELIGENG